jgi:hypothetical protein
MRCQILFFTSTFEITKEMHQVRPRNVHHGGIISSCKFEHTSRRFLNIHRLYRHQESVIHNIIQETSKNRCWIPACTSRFATPCILPLCEQELETVEHLLLHCVMERETWHIFLQLSGFFQSECRPRILGWLSGGLTGVCEVEIGMTSRQWSLLLYKVNLESPELCGVQWVSLLSGRIIETVRTEMTLWQWARLIRGERFREGRRVIDRCKWWVVALA